MVAVPKPSQRARQQLPVLSELVQALAYAAVKQPEAAAREMALAVQQDWRKGVDPYGNAWAPVEGRRYDPARHVADSYYPVVSGTDAEIVSEHKGSAALQKPFKRRPGRRSHPTKGQGLGTWEKRITRMHRRLLHGALMGEERRAETKALAGQRAALKQQRFEERNRWRISQGLKPLRPRKVRSDRARIDALVVRAIS